MREKMPLLHMDDSFATRYLNEGFSGGEKKRAEILQLALLEPSLAILDETDSGLDIDALRVVSEGVNNLMNENMGMLLITHYQRLLNHIKPHYVHIMMAAASSRAVARSWRSSSRPRATRSSRPSSPRFWRSTEDSYRNLPAPHHSREGAPTWLQHPSHKLTLAITSTGSTTRKITSTSPRRA